MKTPKNQRAKKFSDWSGVKEFLKDKPHIKVEKINFIPNKFDEKEWTW